MISGIVGTAFIIFKKIQNKHMEIYYFSGTGNSLHIAQKIKDNFPSANLIPIASLMDAKNIISSSSQVGFVFPIHLAAMPVFIARFITKIDLSSADYIFAITTRTGTQHSAFIELKKILKRKGKKLNASFSVNMPSNDPKFSFKELDKNDFDRIDQMVNKKFKKIFSVISGKENYNEKDIDFITRVPFVGALSLLVKLTDGLETHFYADEKCAGCGTCQKVCPAKRIVMVNDRPEWQKIKNVLNVMPV